MQFEIYIKYTTVAIESDLLTDWIVFISFDQIDSSTLLGSKHFM